MKVEFVDVKLTDYPGSLVKATVDIYIHHDFVIRGVEVRYANGSLWLSFPKSKSGEAVFVPTADNSRRMIQKIVIAAYWKKLKSQKP